MPDAGLQGKRGGFVAGIDAGGTGVRSCVTSLDGKTVWQGEASSDSDGGPEPAIELLREAGFPLRSVAAGIAKITRPGVERDWRAALGEFSSEVSVVPDYEIGFWASAPEGVGAAVLAGTGSVVFARNRQGQTLRVGGRGWEYGDEGSGTFLTEALLRRTVRALDGLSELTALQSAATEVLRAPEAGALVFAARERAQSDGRGFLAPLILERAKLGDREARNLFVGAAGWLATLAQTALERLGFAAGEAVPVFGVGGLWRAEELLVAPFDEVLRRKFPNASFEISRAAPLEGAVKLALRGTS